MSKNSLTKDAKNFAIVMFGLLPTTLTFRRPYIIHPRSRKAMDNLVENGYLERISHRYLPPDAIGWKPTEKMREFRGKPLPDKEDLFPLTTE